MSDFVRAPWLFGAPDGLRSDLHGTAELEAAWEAMRERVRGLERERNAARERIERMAVLNRTFYDQTFTSPEAALHAAGLVEDEDHE